MQSILMILGLILFSCSSPSNNPVPGCEQWNQWDDSYTYWQCKNCSDFCLDPEDGQQHFLFYPGDRAASACQCRVNN
jgi:hypothetical protein